MATSIHRDVFKLEDQHDPIRFGARFIESDGLKEKWAGEIPEILATEENRIITNSEGKAYKVDRIIEGVPEGYHGKYFWIEAVQ